MLATIGLIQENVEKRNLQKRNAMQSFKSNYKLFNQGVTWLFLKNGSPTDDFSFKEKWMYFISASSAENKTLIFLIVYFHQNSNVEIAADHPVSSWVLSM